MVSQLQQQFLEAGEQAVAAPAPRTISLKKSCDFCVKRKRYCDGFGRKHCSFCISKNRPECHYSIRTPVAPSKASMILGTTGDHPTQHYPPLTGVSFWRRGEEEEKNNCVKVEGPGGTQLTTATDSAMRGGAFAGPLPPLKRGRFSASPATGLIGLLENELLGDFFECLGFLSLATGSIVRDAMVSIMQASSPKHQKAVSSTMPAYGGDALIGNWATEEEAQQALVSSSGGGGGCGQTGGCWSTAVTTGGENLPRDASTCMLWCAIALGALVRGRPLAQVERYADLARDSLAACSNGDTLDTARAYLVMAFLLNFQGNQGIRQVLRYAGKAWVFERDLASPEEIDGYWENTTPIWQLSDRVVEQDVCGLVLSVDVHVDQILFEERCAKDEFLVEVQRQHSPKTMSMMASTPLTAVYAEEQDVEGGVGGFVEAPPPVAEEAGEEAEHDRFSTIAALLGMHKETMPELLRLDGCLEM